MDRKSSTMGTVKRRNRRVSGDFINEAPWATGA